MIMSDLTFRDLGQLAMKPKNKVIFVIKDEVGFVWGLAPTKVQAQKQIRWFLPRGGKYIIEPQVIPYDKDIAK